MPQSGHQFARGGGMLSDMDIRAYIERGSIQIYNSENSRQGQFDLEEQLQINAIDLHVGPIFRRFILPKDSESITQKSLKERAVTTPFECQEGMDLRIESGEVLLASTREFVVLDNTVSGYVAARNGVGRLAILVNCTAPLIKPGHSSTIPLQLVNLNRYPVDIKLDVPICQIAFFPLSTPSSAGYAELPDAKYVGEGSEPRESRLYEGHEAQLQSMAEESNTGLSTTDAGSGFKGRLRNALYHPVVQGGLAAYATYSVVEYLGSLVKANLGDVASFLSGIPLLSVVASFFGAIPLNFILGLIAVIVLFYTTRRDRQ